MAHHAASFGACQSPTKAGLPASQRSSNYVLLMSVPSPVRHQVDKADVGAKCQVVARVAAVRPTTAHEDANISSPLGPHTNPGSHSRKLPSISGHHAREEAEETVLRFFDALNTRDISSLLVLVSGKVVLQDLSHERPAVGQLGLARFYSELLTSLHEDMHFVVEECAAGDHKVAVMWHMKQGSLPVPYASGVSFFGLDETNRISYIRQAPEHWVKVGGWAQGLAAQLAAPVLQIGAAALPGVFGGVAAMAESVISQAGMLPTKLIHDSLVGGPATRKQLSPRTTGSSIKKNTHNQNEMSRPYPNSSTQSSTVQQAVSHDTAQTQPVQSRIRPSIPTASPQTAYAAGQTAPITTGSDAPPLTAFNGIWTKDAAASDADAYERALDVWAIHGPQRATARLIEGMEIRADANKFSVHFLTIIPMFKVTEDYKLDGKAKVARRDMRPGSAQATLKRHTNGVTSHTTWSAPHQGSLEEVYELSSDGTSLSITSTITVGARSETTRAVWGRTAAGVTKADILKEQEAQHGSANSILRRFGMPV